MPCSKWLRRAGIADAAKRLTFPVLAALLAGATAGASPLKIEIRTIEPPLMAPQPGIADRRPDMLPDGVVVRGHRDIRAAWLTGPSRRYPHGALGDAIEATGMAVETAEGTVLSLMLGPDAVFEDRFPRLTDMEGDGRGEALIVMSTVKSGAALVLAGIRNGRLLLVAQGPAIGLPNRWLNPVGAADFDGDGRIETAHVETPHIGGILVISRLNGDRLEPVHRVRGFSNHRFGSRELGMSAILDADGDGIADIVLPDRARTALRIVTFAGGAFRRLGRIRLGAEIVSGLKVISRDTRQRIALILSGGRNIEVVIQP